MGGEGAGDASIAWLCVRRVQSLSSERNRKNVDPDIITRILPAMAAAPTGGNAQSVEYTVIDDKDRGHEILQKAYSVMDAKAKRHEYTHGFSDFYYGKMTSSEKTLRKDDMLFCGAQHLFVCN